MSSRAPRSAVLAILAALALVASLPAAASAGSHPAVPAQDAPDDSGATGGPDGATPTLQDGVEFEGIDDPVMWEQYLTEAGVTSVSCEADASGYDSYAITDEPPQGLEWVTAALLTDQSIYLGTYWEYFLPAAGDELFYYETDAQGPRLPIDLVILCSGDASQWVGFGDPTDPAHWEEALAESDDVTQISCTAEDVDADAHLIESPAPAGTEWLLLLLVPEFAADNERFYWWFWEGTVWSGDPLLHRIDLPETSVEYVLPSPDTSAEASLSIGRVVLCSGDLTDGQQVDGGGEPIGPPIETDVPAPAGGPGPGAFAALAAAAALLTGAVQLTLRRSAARR